MLFAYAFVVYALTFMVFRANSFLESPHKHYGITELASMESRHKHSWEHSTGVHGITAMAFMESWNHSTSIHGFSQRY